SRTTVMTCLRRGCRSLLIGSGRSSRVVRRRLTRALSSSALCRGWLRRLWAWSCWGWTLSRRSAPLLSVIVLWVVSACLRCWLVATTTPAAIRRGLLLVAAYALAGLQDAVRRVDPADVRALLLAAGPAVMDHYATGSSVLATDWYEELREAANPA